MSSSNTEAVHTESLVRHYRLGQSVIRAVDGVSLSVKKAEFAALLGASGSGKSTLMNLNAGLSSHLILARKFPDRYLSHQMGSNSQEELLSAAKGAG